VILDDKLRVFTANPAFYRFFKVTPKESLDHSIFELHGSKWDIPELRRFLEEVTPMDKEFQDYDLEYDFPRIGHRKMIVNARRVEEQDGSGPMTILSFREASTK
jgi:two-component system CheB/CheR fusion protein